MPSRCFHGIPRLSRVAMLVVLLNGCATMGGGDPRDPLEAYNRTMFRFNRGMDEHVFDPVARAYRRILPGPVDTGISHVFSNVNDIAVIVNDILQGKLAQAAADTGRLLINSTIGLAGFVDVAADMGLKKHAEDFGQTLAVWGIGPGPYLIAPLLGPATVRDGLGFLVDAGLLNPVTYVDADVFRAGVLALQYVDVKADLLSTRRLIGDASLDEYEFTKNAFLDRRENLIHDRDAFAGEFPDDFPED